MNLISVVLLSVLALPDSLALPSSPSVILSASEESTVAPPASASEESPAPLRFSAVAFLSYDGELSPGVAVFCMKGKWGGYVSFRSNFVPSSHAYDCMSDGTVDGGGSFWGTGDSRLSESSICLGVARSVLPWLNLYAGAGAGKSLLLWEDASQNWSLVKDASPRGLVLDAGAQARFGRLSVLAGMSWLTASSPSSGHCPPAANIGVGFSF